MLGETYPYRSGLGQGIVRMEGRGHQTHFRVLGRVRLVVLVHGRVQQLDDLFLVLPQRLRVLIQLSLELSFDIVVAPQPIQTILAHQATRVRSLLVVYGRC